MMTHQVTPAQAKPDHCEARKARSLVWELVRGFFIMARAHLDHAQLKAEYTTATCSLSSARFACNWGGDHIRNDGLFLNAPLVNLFFICV